MKPNLLTRTFMACIGLLFFAKLNAQNVPELIYFKFNSATSGNVTNDADPVTRVSTNGTLNGISLGSPGQFGTAMQGNGGATASNSTNANWALNVNTSWTISMWISGVTNTASSNYIFGGSGGSTFRAMTGTGLVSGGGNIKVRSSGMTDIDLIGVFDATGSPVVVHIVYDKAAGQSRTYKNGVLLSTTSQPTSLTFTGTDFRVGGYGTANGLPSGARLDEFRFYNRALSATEISSTWNIEITGCASPTTVTYSNLKQTSVTLNWPAVPASIGYEYAVTTSSTPPTSGTPTTALTGNASGLVPATTHYAHVRNKCGTSAFSAWKTVSFITPICKSPDTVRTGVVTDTSAMLIWNNIPAAQDYEYILDQDPTIPPVTATGTIVSNNHVLFGGLQENTTYHFFLRSKCFGSDVSEWTNLSFTTRASCKPPTVTVNPQPGSAEVSWDKVPFSVGYEYAVNKMPSPPSLGTPIFTEQVTVPLTDPGSAYYFHVRTKCYDIFTASEWGTTQLQMPTGISSSVAGTGMLKVFPNPVKEKLTIETAGMDGLGTVSIIDMTGKVVHKITAVGTTAEIDMRGYAKGLYLVRYVNGDRSQIVKIIKE